MGCAEVDHCQAIRFRPWSGQIEVIDGVSETFPKRQYVGGSRVNADLCAIAWACGHSVALRLAAIEFISTNYLLS
jgi:hypothetical protein